MYVNKKSDRSGPLVCKPTCSQHIDSDEYFRWVFAYIHTNPIKSHIRRSSVELGAMMKAYRFSSYHDYFIGERPESVIIARDVLPMPQADIGTFDDLIRGLIEANKQERFDPTDRFVSA